MEIKAALPSLLGRFFEIETLELREPGPEEVLVKLVASGVCHTDIAMLTGRLMVLGHEGSGIVEAVGPDAGDLKVGDHVVLSYPSCGACDACQNKKPYKCSRFDDLFMGDRLQGSIPLRYKGRIVIPFFGQGSFATYTVVHKSSAVKVRKDVDLKLLGPLGCGIQTGAGAILNYLKPRPGKAIAIFGTGSVGLSAILAARVAGCAPIIAVEKLEQRLEMAKKFGATHMINASVCRDIKKEIILISGGLRYAFDTTGSVELMEIAVSCFLPGGRGCGVAAAGQPHLGPEASALKKSWEEIIQGCAVSSTFIPHIVELFRKGQFPFDEMLTFFDFSDINKAFEKAEAGEVVKPVLLMKP